MQITQNDVNRVKWTIDQVDPAIDKFNYSFDGLNNIMTLNLFIDNNIIAEFKLRKLGFGIFCTNISFNENFYSDFDEFKNTLYNYFLYNKNDITKLIDLTKFTFDIGLKNIASQICSCESCLKQAG